MLTIKPTFKSEAVPLLVITASIITSFVSYDRLPARVVSHWNIYGQPDGFSSRHFLTIFFPGLIILMYALFLLLPNIDPKKERYQEFTKTYNIFRALFLLIFYAIFLLAILANLGYGVSIGKTVPLIIGLLMILIGNYLGKIKNNWFIGIRTPWTLSSERVWNKTHRFGGRMFVLFGLLLIIIPFVSKVLSAPLFILGLLLAVVAPIVYSYIEYKKEK